MHHIDLPDGDLTPENRVPWYRLLNRYHWFVLAVAALGWLFDCLDQQLFILARPAAMEELIPDDAYADTGEVKSARRAWGDYATSIFIAGWATGGLIFGMLGDRIGRAKTMIITILMYSLFTGLSSLSTSVWDFSAYRFLTGLGVGGEFAVGVSLVAEVMPAGARTYALGLLQALSAVGNISAAFINMGLGLAAEQGLVESPWRIMFLIGAVPALLALVIRRRLKEPEKWQRASHDDVVTRQLGSYKELFGDPTLRKHAILGLILGSAGMIGLWTVGFFTMDLIRFVQRQPQTVQLYQAEIEKARQPDWVETRIAQLEERRQRETEPDRISLYDSMIEETRSPNAAERRIERLETLLAGAQNLNLSQALEQKSREIAAEIKAAEEKDDQEQVESLKNLHLALRNLKSASDNPEWSEALEEEKNEIPAAIEAARSEGNAQRARHLENLQQAITSDSGSVEALDPEEKKIETELEPIVEGRLLQWSSYVSLAINIGAAFGMFGFGALAQRIGRKPTFRLALFAAYCSTVAVFLFLQDMWQVWVMVPVMGFCQLSLFAGYAIYFPELFPTRLRATGTSFCYNVARYVVAAGLFLKPVIAGFFAETEEPLRYAGATMCTVFLIGFLVLPFLPETKDAPLPD